MEVSKGRPEALLREELRNQGLRKVEDAENKPCFFLILSRAGHKFGRERERRATEELKPALKVNMVSKLNIQFKFQYHHIKGLNLVCAPGFCCIT